MMMLGGHLMLGGVVLHLAETHAHDHQDGHHNPVHNPLCRPGHTAMATPMSR